MDGNLAPNAGIDMDYWQEPEEQITTQREELSKRNDPQFVLASIYEWFSTQAEKCDHISNISYDIDMPVEAQIAALVRLKYLLNEKADEFREFQTSL